MGEMRDSDWSRENVLRSDWSVPKGATITTDKGNFAVHDKDCRNILTNACVPLNVEQQSR